MQMGKQRVPVGTGYGGDQPELGKKGCRWRLEDQMITRCADVHGSRGTRADEAGSVMQSTLP